MVMEKGIKDGVREDDGESQNRERFNEQILIMRLIG